MKSSPIIARSKAQAIAAEAAFRKRLAELGVELLEEKWLGANTPHRIRCPLGHEGSPVPASLRRGNGACRTCAGKNPAAAEANFRKGLADIGAVMLEPRWLGVNNKHRVRCSAGHETTVFPVNLQRRGTCCAVCGRRDPATAALNFHVAVVRLGGEVLEPFWLGDGRPHRVVCAKGHRGKVRPGHIAGGRGLCRRCSYRAWDVFYVLASPEGSIKFGITSGDPKDRLKVHRRDGYTEVVRLVEGMVPGAALTLEQVCRSALVDARIDPVRGREYFPAADSLEVVLDIVDGWTTD